MKMTVITVCYNAAATLAETLKSVAEQSHGDVEHIVIDGGSRDGSVDMVEAGLRPGGRFVSERDEGIYDAMNKGLAMASGDVIGMLNADDRFADRDALASVAAAFEGSAGVDAVLGDAAFFAAGRPDRIIRRYRSGRFAPERLAWGIMPAHPGMYLTRQAYDRVGKYRTDFRIASDYEFIVRAFARHRLSYVHLDRILVLMQMGGVSTSGLAANMLINREVLRACRDNGVYSNPLMIASKYPRKLLEFIS